MAFDENIDEKYEVYEVDGFKVAIEKDLLKQYDYVEIKHGDSFVQRGFYPSILKPEN